MDAQFYSGHLNIGTTDSRSEYEVMHRNYYHNALWRCWRRAKTAFLLTEAAVYPCFVFFDSFN